VPQHQLPIPPTPLVGRVRELTELRERLLREDVRLLTLTGTGGTGKTRLALALAAGLVDVFPDATWFVDLSAVTDPSIVPSAIAQLLGVRVATPESELQAIGEYIRHRHMLLVLDNFEQVLPAAMDVADLLSAGERLKVVVTSRAPLHIYGEHEFPVQPLELPVSGDSLPSKGLTQYESVALFVQRARAARPDFDVTNHNAASVAEICARLDGLPLAIELAAARVKLLPPQALLGRLDNRLQLLTGGSRDRPARHQTLRATLEWSYGLLDEAEKAAFWRLAVFSGGWTLEAAEALGVLDTDVLERVGSLLDKSLVRQELTTRGEPRFRMLETIHEFALDQLERNEDVASLRARHAAYFLGLAEAAEIELRGPPSTEWLERLQNEHDNLRAVVRWALETHNAELALRICSALQRYLDARGHLSEGQRWLESALGLAPSASGPVRARALQAAGQIAWLGGDYVRASDRHQESLEIWRSLGDDRGVALALTSLGNVSHYQGDYVRAEGLYRQSLEVHRRMHNAFGSAAVLNSLGVLARNRGDLERAREYGAEALRLHRDLGDTRNVALVLNNLARVEREAGRWTEAVALCTESLGLFGEMLDAWGISMVLINLGILGQQMDDVGRAARLFGAAEALREQATGSTFLSVSPAERTAYESSVDAVRNALGETAFASMWQTGRTLSLREVLHEGAGLRPSSSDRSKSHSPETSDPLTAREREVAILVATGHTNRQIGEALVITEWTVDTHVRHILAKLGLRSRTQVAAWAAERHLVGR